MKFSLTSIVCFISLILIACDKDEAITPALKPLPETPVKAPPVEKTKLPEIEPKLDLSVDNIPLDFLQDGTVKKDISPEFDFLNTEKTIKNSALFEALNKKPEESDMSLSGKVLLNDNDDYLESIDGAQIKIKIKTE